MKTIKEDLIKRGYIFKEHFDKYALFSDDQLFMLLVSNKAYERSISIHILGIKKYKEEKFVKQILSLLKKEKKLYTRLEIAEVLKKVRGSNTNILINYLGEIGNNQYKNLPTICSKKKSYPLPRDIIARILGNTDSKNFGILINDFDKIDLKKQRELIDSIGYMVFYNKELQTNKNLGKIFGIIKINKDEIVFWKLIIVLSGFNFDKSKDFLNKIILENKNNIYVLEAKRSLKILNEK